MTSITDRAKALGLKDVYEWNDGRAGHFSLLYSHRVAYNAALEMCLPVIENLQMQLDSVWRSPLPSHSVLAKMIAGRCDDKNGDLDINGYTDDVMDYFASFREDDMKKMEAMQNENQRLQKGWDACHSHLQDRDASIEEAAVLLSACLGRGDPLEINPRVRKWLEAYAKTKGES